MKTTEYNLIIIGAGPAGLTAGIYAARGGLKTVIIEKAAAGGLASTAANVENYPGIPSASGFDICYAMLKQCYALGVEFVYDKITKCDLSPEIKTVTLDGGDKLQAKDVIIAAGASPKTLGIPNEDKLTGRGVSYCATCDGALFRGKTVAVVGGGNTAVEDALYLERLAKKVYLIHRRDALRADKILADRLLASNVEPVWDSVVTDLEGDDHLTEIVVKNVKNEVLSTLSVDCVFVAIGQQPNIDGFETLADESGYIKTDENMRTSIPHVYAAGDIRKKSLRQIVTACADGAIAACSALTDS